MQQQPAATLPLPPGPAGGFLLGSLPEFAGDVLGFLTRCVRDHGDFVHFRLPGNEVYFLHKPADIETVLLTQRTNFVKHSFFWKHVTAIFGRGLLTSEGDFWLKQRRLSAPAFHPERIAGYGDVMSAFTERLVNGWRDGEVRDIHHDMMRVTMEIVSKTLFDVDVEEDLDRIGRSFDVVIREIAKRFRRPVRIPDGVPIPGNVRYNRGVRLLDRIIGRVIAERRARPGDRGDLLSMLLAARDENGRPMSDRQLRDETITLFVAGHETTAIAISWTLFLLARHPEIEERLHREIAGAVGNRLPAASDLPRLPFAEAVVKESLRLYPPAYVIGREALKDCVVGGYRIPARATVYFSPWVLHRDARWFPDPESFRPDRWSDGSTAKLPRYVYIPFGGGPRICIGERFAMMEAVLVLTTILRRFRLEMAGPDPVPFLSITLRPEGGPVMKVRDRGGSEPGSEIGSRASETAAVIRGQLDRKS
ncbi:MAG: cytochrome P450 [Acidobacteriota bacterium]|nr:cytochrome P450 [Acidobacteriota bacterium]